MAGVSRQRESTTSEKADLMGAYSTGLWDYALSLYDQSIDVAMHDGSLGLKDVMSACLSLQEEAGYDVCELLWIHWLAANGVMLATSPTAQTGADEPRAHVRRQCLAQIGTPL